MAIVDIKIRSNNYQIACADDQKDHIKHLAKLLIDRIEESKDAFAKAPDSLMILMIALQLQEELQNAKKLKSEAFDAIKNSDEIQAYIQSYANNSVAEALETVAEYIDTVVGKVE